MRGPLLTALGLWVELHAAEDGAPLELVEEASALGHALRTGRVVLDGDPRWRRAAELVDELERAAVPLRRSRELAAAERATHEWRLFERGARELVAARTAKQGAYRRRA